MSGSKNKSGTIYKHGDGKWGFVLDLGDDPTTGKRRRIRRNGFAKKGDADEALTAMKAELQQGTFATPTRITVREYLVDRWLPTAASRVRATTFDTYRRLVERHVLPHLGAVQLQQLDEALVEQWTMALHAAGLSPKSIRNVHAVLHKALHDALRQRLTSRNAASGTPMPRSVTPKPRVWDIDQTQRFLAHVATDRWAPLWRLIAVTGMRRGEALGLRWDDVTLHLGTGEQAGSRTRASGRRQADDAPAGIITVRNQRTIAGGRAVEGVPKSAAGNRTVALDKGTAEALRAWRKQQAAERLAMGEGWHDSGGLVFTWPDGTPPWPQRVSQWFREHAAAAGLPPIGVHGLRHSAATFMIADGENPKVVSQRLGHSNIGVTLHLYSHVLPGHDQAAADRLGRALDG